MFSKFILCLILQKNIPIILTFENLIIMKKIQKKLAPLSLILLMFCFNSCDELTTNTSLTETEISQGLKEALRVGTDSSSYNAHKLDGYFKNAEIKIPFPPEAKNAETLLRAAFLGSLVDAVVLKLNRAAEDAADDAKGIFIDAITKMTIVDALNILNGANNAATTYLRSKTYDSLKIIFKPQIQTSLASVGATTAWTSLTTSYNGLPLGGDPINTDLADYATTKALDGLFVLVAEEELKIRTDPIARVTAILQKVFGN